MIIQFKRGFNPTSVARSLRTLDPWHASLASVQLQASQHGPCDSGAPSTSGRTPSSSSPPLASSRHLHSSPSFASLGVVEQLHDEVTVALPADASRSFWEVVEFRPDGTALETWKTPEVLGLHPRDVHLFTSDHSGSHRAMLAPRSGAILFRTEAAKAVIYADRVVLFPARRLNDTVKVAQAIKSALSQRSALPFELKVLESLLAETARWFDTKSKRLGLVAEAVVEDINRNFHASGAELQRFIPVTGKLSEMQHDLKETLDAITDVANYDDQLQLCCLTERARALANAAAAAKAASSTATGGGGTSADGGVPGGGGGGGGAQSPSAAQQTSTAGGGAQAPPPHDTVTRNMSTISSMGGTLGATRGGGGGGVQEEDSSTINNNGHNGSHNGGFASTGGRISPPFSIGAASVNQPTIVRTPHMRMASRILEAYEFKMLSTQGALSEMLENMEQTRTVWHMQLDHQRNRVLRVNLLVSLASFGGFMSTIPAAYFGMNLDSGLEDTAGIFWPVVQGSLLIGLSTTALLYAYYKFGPKRRYAARLSDMRSLRDLLFYHMDDMDSIIEAVKAKGSLTKGEFKKIVASAVKGRPMSPEEISLLFRVLDQNKDAVLELSELVRMEDMADHLSDQLAHHTS